MDFKLKYLKYKSKCINLKKQLGSGSLEIIPSKEGKDKQTEQLGKRLEKAGFKTKKDVFKKFRSKRKKEVQNFIYLIKILILTMIIL